jgi:hypothetical protein
VGVAKVREIGRECVAIEENDVIGVDSANGLVDAVIEGNNACVVRVGGLVEWIVSRDPFVALVMCRELFPKPDYAILVIFMIPDCSILCVHLTWN